MPNVEEFRRDLLRVLERTGATGESRERLVKLVDKLSELHERGMVKINHSVMELVVSWHLLRKGYDAIEVETGFTPPESSVDPLDYLKARIASKIARYGAYAEKFSLAVPPYYVPPVHPIFFKPPRERRSVEALELKRLLDRYYKRPPISLDELISARLHSVMIVDVDNARVEEVDPEAYFNGVYWLYYKMWRPLLARLARPVALELA